MRTFASRSFLVASMFDIKQVVPANRNQTYITTRGLTLLTSSRLSKHEITPTLFTEAFLRLSCGVPQGSVHGPLEIFREQDVREIECLMAPPGKMRKGKLFLLFFASVFFVTVCEGNKVEKLKHLIKDFKGESDNLANEIYAWIDKHRKGSQSHDHARHESRDHIKSPGLTKTRKKENIEEVIEMLKGESDHLASEIYAWIDKHRNMLLSHGKSREHGHGLIDKHRKGFLSHGRPRGHGHALIVKHRKGFLSHGRPRGHGHALIDKHRKGFMSHDKPRHGHGLIDRHRKGFLSRDHAHKRHHLRSRRSIMRRSSDDGNVVEGESIQDVMRDLMNAPHPKVKRHDKNKQSKKIKKSFKRKLVKKAKRTSTKNSYKKGNEKNRIHKHVKPVSPSKKSKTSKKKKTSSAHVIKAVKKSGGLADLLKVISADPSKKIVVTKGKKDVTLDSKSLTFFKRIPKPFLQKLIENVELNKYFNIDTYISGEQAGKTRKEVVAKKKNNLNKVAKKSHDSTTDEEMEERKLKIKVKKLSKKGEKKSSFQSKKARDTNKGAKKRKLRKAKTKDERAVSKSRVTTHEKSKKTKGSFNSKKKQSVQRKEKARKASAKIGHQKLAELKDKIKKTNSLKFKVAKALLEHCETQNKLKKVFDNVNASLKEASHLAKAIGKKFGIKKSDLDKLTTKHTEEAVQEFLNKIF